MYWQSTSRAVAPCTWENVNGSARQLLYHFRWRSVVASCKANSRQYCGWLNKSVSVIGSFVLGLQVYWRLGDEHFEFLRKSIVAIYKLCFYRRKISKASLWLDSLATLATLAALVWEKLCSLFYENAWIKSFIYLPSFLPPHHFCKNIIAPDEGWRLHQLRWCLSPGAQSTWWSTCYKVGHKDTYTLKRCSEGNVLNILKLIPR